MCALKQLPFFQKKAELSVFCVVSLSKEQTCLLSTRPLLSFSMLSHHRIIAIWEILFIQTYFFLFGSSGIFFSSSFSRPLKKSVQYLMHFRWQKLSKWDCCRGFGCKVKVERGYTTWCLEHCSETTVSVIRRIDDRHLKWTEFIYFLVCFAI